MGLRENESELETKRHKVTQRETEIQKEGRASQRERGGGDGGRETEKGREMRDGKKG